MKKLNKKIVLILLSMIALTLMSACGSEGTDGATSAEGGVTDSLVIGTGGSSGTYYAIGAGMSQIINDNSDINAISQGTNGAIENVRLLNSESIDIGMGNWDALYFGYEGTDAFDEKQDVVALMNLYLSGGQMAVKADSGIEDYKDLAGKKINLGPQGSTITEMSKIILKYNGIDPEKDIEPYYLSFQEGGTKLRDNDLDATFYVAGIPTAGLIDLSTGSDIRLLSLSEEISEQIVKDYPYYDKITIPAGTYNGVDYDVESLQLWTALMVNPKMSDETAYETVKILMENIEDLRAVHNAGADISLETAALSPIPLHPGAEKYFKEQGILE